MEVRVSAITAIWTVGHRLRSTPTNGHRFTALSLPWWSPIQVLTGLDVTQLQWPSHRVSIGHHRGPLYMIGTQFQRLYLCLRCLAIQWTKVMWHKRKSTVRDDSISGLKDACFQLHLKSYNNCKWIVVIITHLFSLCNVVPVLSTSWDIGIFGLEGHNLWFSLAA